MENITNSITSRGSNDNSSPRALQLPGPIEVDSPACAIRFVFRCLQLGPVVDEVYERLGHDSSSRHVFQPVRPKLNSPLSNPVSCFRDLDDISQRSGTDHSDGMALKVLLKLPACHKHSIHQLLPMGISLFRLNKHLTDVLNRPLNRIFLASLLVVHHNGHTDSTCVSSHI